VYCFREKIKLLNETSIELHYLNEQTYGEEGVWEGISQHY